MLAIYLVTTRHLSQVVFRRHVRRLKEEKSAKKLRKQLSKLPQVLARMQLPTEELNEKLVPYNITYSNYDT